MKIKCNYSKICLVLLLCLSVQVSSKGQAFMARSVAPAKAEKVSIAEGLTGTEHQLLLQLVTKAGLMPLLSGADTYTFFAPSGAALQPYHNAKPEELRNLLSQHIVKGSLSADELKDGSTLKTINGSTIRVYRKKGTIHINGKRLHETDQLYANGVWHQLNGCLTVANADL